MVAAAMAAHRASFPLRLQQILFGSRAVSQAIKVESESIEICIPIDRGGSFSPFYYSFDAGGIYFIMLVAYADYNKSGEQYEWLEKDLAKVDRSVTPWLIGRWHTPWYTTYKAHYRDAECMRVAMEELL
ncbi:hypothetical protein ABZP36_005993 [Zizania latifolia]